MRALGISLLGAIVLAVSSVAAFSPDSAGAGHHALTTDVLRARGLHKADLGRDEARSATTRFLNYEYEEAWYRRNRESGNINCDTRLAMHVRRCRFTFMTGSSGYMGTLRVAVFEGVPGELYARIKYRITQINKHCLNIEDRPWRGCADSERGVARLRF